MGGRVWIPDKPLPILLSSYSPNCSLTSPNPAVAAQAAVAEYHVIVVKIVTRAIKAVPYNLGELALLTAPALPAAFRNWRR